MTDERVFVCQDDGNILVFEDGEQIAGPKASRCPTCGCDLTDYANPQYCPDCGTQL